MRKSLQLADIWGSSADELENKDQLPVRPASGVTSPFLVFFCGNRKNVYYDRRKPVAKLALFLFLRFKYRWVIKIPPRTTRKVHSRLLPRGVNTLERQIHSEISSFGTGTLQSFGISGETHKKNGSWRPPESTFDSSSRKLKITVWHSLDPYCCRSLLSDPLRFWLNPWGGRRWWEFWWILLNHAPCEN